MAVAVRLFRVWRTIAARAPGYLSIARLSFSKHALDLPQSAGPSSTTSRSRARNNSRLAPKGRYGLASSSNVCGVVTRCTSSSARMAGIRRAASSTSHGAPCFGVDRLDNAGLGDGDLLAVDLGLEAGQQLDQRRVTRPPLVHLLDELARAVHLAYELTTSPRPLDGRGLEVLDDLGAGLVVLQAELLVVLEPLLHREPRDGRGVSRGVQIAADFERAEEYVLGALDARGLARLLDVLAFRSLILGNSRSRPQACSDANRLRLIQGMGAFVAGDSHAVQPGLPSQGADARPHRQLLVDPRQPRVTTHGAAPMHGPTLALVCPFVATS